jgi:phospholipase/lecithinase/hemolysin
MTIPNRKVPAVLATTALMILRNRLSEGVWGSHGVDTFPAVGPPPDRAGSTRSPFGRPRSQRRITTPSGRHGTTSTQRPRSRSGWLGGVGVIGDSISDEYRFYAPDRVTARNWVEILSAARGLDFGAPSIASPGGTWDRRFAYNWSQSSSTTSSLMAQRQHKGLAAQVAGGAPIGLAAVTVGTNDFAHVLFTSRSVEAMGPTLDRASSNLAAILDSLLAASPTLKVAAFTAVDLRQSPLIRGASEAGLIAPAMARAYGAAVACFNERLRDYASGIGRRIVVVDEDRLLFDIVTADRFAVGSVELDRFVAGNDIRHLFLRDGFHPGTIGQCLIANEFLGAINAGFGTHVPLLGGEEMVGIAGDVPRPTGLSLIVTGVLALFGYGRRRRPQASLHLRSTGQLDTCRSRS